MCADGRPFAHPALFYKGRDDYLSGVGGFLRGGLAAGEPVFAAVPPDSLAMLTEYLGADAALVQLENMAEIGRNPGRILGILGEFIDRCGAGGGRLVGEPIWAARSPAELREATRHEALINVAFAAAPVTVLCPYDVSRLSPATLADAERTHPVLLSNGVERRSAAYTDPMVLAAELDAERGPEPADAERLAFGPAELVSLRRRAEQFGRAAGLSAERAVDLKIAVGEAASNSIRYGGGAGKLSMWRADDRVVVEIRDSGRLADPLAGRRRPPDAATGGRGLWMIHNLCDLVELAPGMLRLHVSP